MAVGADFPAGAVQNGSPEGGGVDGAGDGGGGRGDVGAQSATGASWSKLAGGCWESESSKWSPGWRSEGAAMKWPSSVGERRAGWAIGETGAAGWTIAAILDRMRNRPRNWPGLVPVAAAAGGYPLTTPEAAPVGGDDAGAGSVPGGGGGAEVGPLLSPAFRSTSSAIPVDSGSPSRGSAADRRPDGLGALAAVEPPLAVARTD